MRNYVQVYGKLTDFNETPIEDGEVVIKNASFENIYSTRTNKDGEYKLEVKKGNYFALFACKDYAIKNLEYWAWNFAVYKDEELNIKIDGLEVYAINAFIIQRKTFSMMIYFRPMSLKRWKEYKNTNVEGVIDISPKLKIEDIEVKINDEIADIIGINQIYEKDIKSGESIISYLIQVIPSLRELKKDYNKIHITIIDQDTNEKGEGSLYWKNEQNAIT